jgi:hypothetical protein
MWKRLSRMLEYSILIAAITSVVGPTVQRQELQERSIRLGLRLGEKVAAASPAWQMPPPASSVPQQACFESERFLTYDEWAGTVRDWNAKRPPLPNPVHAFEALRLVKKEQAFARRRFKSDKQMHCYVGCRIAQDTDFTTAQFAAWEKERRDLTDCNGDSHFEELDYTVTVWGAHLGVASSSSGECISTCERSF